MRQRAAWFVMLVPLAPACLSVINADEYRISDKSGSGASGGAGASGAGGVAVDSGEATGDTPGSGGAVDSGSDGAPEGSTGGAPGNPCGSDEVPIDGDAGSCERVGVDDCASAGFESDPDGACRARMPGKDCTTTGLAFPQSTQCTLPTPLCGNDGYPPPLARPVGTVVYASWLYPPCSPRGTPDCPFPSIGEALKYLESLGTGGGSILLRDRVYGEDVTITASNVSIHGCNGGTIAGQSSSMDTSSPCAQVGRLPGRGAAVCIKPGLSGVVLDGVNVVGPGYGVLAYGADVTLRNLSIHDTVSYGLLVQEAKETEALGSAIRRAKATLDHVPVLAAGGVGIQVEGSDLVMRNSSVQATKLAHPAPPNTPPSEDQVGLSRGIALYPSMWSKSAQTTDPGDFARSTATIESSAITGNQEIAVFASGANVKIAKSFLGALKDETAAGRGLVAERSLATGALTEVEVDHSIIEHTRDAAVDVRDAKVDLTQTTIRDSRGRLGDGCSGQGLRVRSLPTVGTTRSDVSLEHVTVLDSRQSAVFAAASTVTLTSTLLRGIAPQQESVRACAKAMGDGLTVESYPGQLRGEVHLDRVRIDGAARAGLFAGDATVSAQSSVIESDGTPVVDATGRLAGERLVGATCGHGGTRVPCAFESSSVPSWASAGPSPAWPDRSNVASICALDSSNPDRALTGASVWNYLAPETIPISIPNNGCADLTGLGVGRVSLALEKPGFDAAATQAYFSAPLTSWLSIWGSAPLATGYARSGWPIGAPLIAIMEAPAFSLVKLDRFNLLTTKTGTTIPDSVLYPEFDPGNTPFSAYAQGLIMVPEGGWYTVTIDVPDRFTCTSQGLSGPNATSIDVHVFPGLSASVFLDCTPAPLTEVLATVPADISLIPNTDGESPLGNLAVDCMRQRSTAPFAVLPLISVQTVLPTGDVTRADIDLLASDGRIAVTTLTTEQIMNFLNAQFGQISMQPLAISGFKYDWTGSPGHVVPGTLRDANDVPLVLGQKYVIALPYFWRNPALSVLKPMPADLTFGPVLADTFATCLKAMKGPVTGTVGGRIRKVP